MSTADELGGRVNFVPPILEALATLSAAAGHLRELGREEVAHRCDNAAAQLQLAAVTNIETDEESVE